MQPLIIRCFHPEASISHPFVFYISNKGHNAGMPLLVSTTDCYKCIATDKAMFDFYFWLCFGLYEAGKFKPSRRRMYCPCINISDIHFTVRGFAPCIYPKYQRYQQILESFTNPESRNISLAEQIVLTRQLQKNLILAHEVKRPQLL